MRKTHPGYFRLGVVLSVAWLVAFPILYIACLRFFPVVAEGMGLYSWVYPDGRHGILHIDRCVLIFGSVLPVVVPWFFLFIIPVSIRWIKAGFAQH
jgi:hypothetical protein